MADFLLYHGFESQQLLLNNCGGGSSAVAYLINFLDLAGWGGYVLSQWVWDLGLGYVLELWMVL